MDVAGDVYRRCLTLHLHHLIGCVHLRSVRDTFLSNQAGKVLPSNGTPDGEALLNAPRML